MNNETSLLSLYYDASLADWLEVELRVVQETVQKSSVTVAMPAGASGSFSPSRDEALPTPLARVLPVEDNLVNQMVAQGQLRTIGCAVDVVANGTEALTVIEKKHYDVVLMDCMMPEMNGYEATRRVRARECETQARRLPARGRQDPAVAPRKPRSSRARMRPSAPRL